MIRVACLVCTNRPEWEPWWRHQIAKQRIPVSPSGKAEGHLSFDFATFVFVDSGPGSIASKREALLGEAVLANCRYLAWFDDDDWSHPLRLRTAIEILESPTSNVLAIDAVGSAESLFVNATAAELKDARALRYRAPEGIIFNGAVFRTDAVPQEFNQGLTVGEDTAWLGEWFRHAPNYMIVGGYQHLWLCHAKNITNRATERTFDERIPRGLITEEEWKLVPR